MGQLLAISILRREWIRLCNDFHRIFKTNWVINEVRHKRINEMVYLPFSFFCTSIQVTACLVNDLGFDFDSVQYRCRPHHLDTSGSKAPSRFARQKTHRLRLWSQITGRNFVVHSTYQIISLATVVYFVRRHLMNGRRFLWNMGSTNVQVFWR